MTTTVFEFTAALVAIDSERDYQDSFWPENAPADPRPLSIGEDILLIEEYQSRAVGEERKGLNALDNVRKIAGIAVRCLENHGGSKPSIPGTLSRMDVYKQISDSMAGYKGVGETMSAATCQASVLTELNRIHELTLQARAQWASARRPEVGALKWVLEIANAAVRCMMNHGAPLRHKN